MLQALHWLKKSGVAVANLSFAGPPDDLLHHAVRELTKAGIVVVAAAGNEGPGAPPSYPAAYEEVIAVTAVDRNLAAYRYASRGDHIDLAAPGVDVWTALPGRREGPQTGTSFAVPYRDGRRGGGQWRGRAAPRRRPPRCEDARAGGDRQGHQEPRAARPRPDVRGRPGAGPRALRC